MYNISIPSILNGLIHFENKYCEMFETNELLQEFYKLFFYDSLLIFVLKSVTKRFRDFEFEEFNSNPILLTILDIRYYESMNENELIGYLTCC